MVEFTYNNSNNTGISHTSFQLNYGYHLHISFKNKCDTRFRSYSTEWLAIELRELINVCHQNLLDAQDLQKQAHDKGVKPWSYILGEKVWFNSKYIKTTKNRKLGVKYFGPFQVLHPVGKQAYKLELLVRWRIHAVFYVSLLE